ncbi:sigma-54 interaction domain-containing protein [Fusibacter bizertensis]
MNQIAFLETVLDNMTDGVYVLDHRGNYVYVNSAYIKMLNMPKSVLLHYNVHDFLETGQINFCISDIVYREKKQIVMFQDVYDTQNFGRKLIRQMVISTPVFNSEGNIQNIVAIVRPQETSNQLYYLASTSNSTSVTSSFQLATPTMDGKIIAKSPAMRKVFSRALAIADVDSSVLLTGESGTGKEVVANFIHSTSNRSKMPYVIVNCASLPENLLEAELFGYEKGAFTGADPKGKHGLFEAADGGIIFLDEINSMPVALQGKILRVIETKQIMRIGSTKNIKVDFRLICATNENIETLIAEKKFRLDLFYRINVVPIYIPPLRERNEDIIPLAIDFLEHFCHKHSKKKVFSTNTIDKIMNYNWPGNVRQLKNFVERSVVVSTDEVIEIRDVQGITDAFQLNEFTSTDESIHANISPILDSHFEELLNKGVGLNEYLEACEKDFLKYVHHKYPNSYKVAEVLNTSQTSIIRRLKKYNFKS